MLEIIRKNPKAVLTAVLLHVLLAMLFVVGFNWTDKPTAEGNMVPVKVVDSQSPYSEMTHVDSPELSERKEQHEKELTEVPVPVGKSSAKPVSTKPANTRTLQQKYEEVAAKNKMEAREKASKEAQLKVQREAEEQARREKAALEAKEEERKEAKAKAEREAKEKTRREAKAKAQREAKEKARKEANAKAAAKEKARKEAKAKAAAEAKEKARKEAQAKAKKEAAEKAKAEAEEKARKAAEEKRIAEQKAREEAEEKARQQAKAEEERKKKAEEGMAALAAAAKARREAEQRAQAAAAAQANERATALGNWGTKIVRHVRPRWHTPPGSGGMSAKVRVNVSRTGHIRSLQVLSCNGSTSFCQSIETAFKNAEPLPRPSRHDLFDENLNLTFKR